MRVSETLHIAAPPERIFQALSDDRETRRWSEGLEEIAYPHGRPSEGSPIGTHFRARMREAGQMVELEGEITAYEPPRHFGVNLAVQGVNLLVDYRLAPDVTGGTEVDAEIRVQASGFMARMMGSVAAGYARTAVGRQLRALKAYCEAPLP